MNKIITVILCCFLVCCMAVLYTEYANPDSSAPLAAESGSSLESLSNSPVEPTTEPVSQAFSTEPKKQGSFWIGSKQEENMLKNILIPVDDSETINEELQTYVEHLGTVDRNVVKMTAEQQDEDYFSGKLESTFGFQYLDFTFRVNTLEGPGLFPAIWMLPVSGARFPELDIYELLGDEPNIFYGVMHYLQDENHERQSFAHDFSESAIPDSYTIRFRWTEDEIAWYLDGEKVFSITDHVPQEPMYLIFNLAVGGNWPGNPTEETKFPATFEVEVLEFLPDHIHIR